MNYRVDDAFIARFERMKRELSALQQVLYGDSSPGKTAPAAKPLSVISVKVATLVSVANVSPTGYVVYECSPADIDGNTYTSNTLYVWTRPDVSVGDVIEAVHLSTGIQASSEYVVWKQPGADLSSPFKVYLTQNGGSNGNKTTDCSYTYDVYFASAKTASSKIGSTLAPESRYVSKCAVTAATKGLACYVNGDVVLEIAYEALTSNACS